MTGSKNNTEERLEERLKSAYERQPVPPVSRSWREGVMRDVMTLSRSESSRPSFWEKSFPLTTLYRFAGISGLCALLLMFVYLTSGGSTDMDLSNLLLKDPLGPMALVLLIP